VTVVFRRCVQIHLLTYLLIYLTLPGLMATSTRFIARLGRSFLMNIVPVLQRIIVSRPTLPDQQYVSAVRILDTELCGVGLRVAGLAMMIVVDVLPPGRSIVRRDAIASREFGRNKRAMVSCLRRRPRRRPCDPSIITAIGATSFLSVSLLCHSVADTLNAYAAL